MNYERELEIARAAAVRAGEQALRYQAGGLTPEDKPDLSPVTIADREGEKLISAMLSDAFPQDGMLGEEGLHKESATGRRWIVDPVDGTRDFIRGLPNWAVLIGLEEGADVVAGVAHFPVQNRTYYAARGMGAYRDGTRLHVSKVAQPSQALLCMNGFKELQEYRFAPKLWEWLNQVWAVRSFGGCQDAVLVASGQADAWLEPVGKPWDFAALKVIAEEAGGVFFNFDGHSSIYGGNCGICTPGLEVELRRLIIGTAKQPRVDTAPPIAGAMS